MNFNTGLLSEYRNLLRKTNIIECYQEFIRLFRYLRIELEKSMPECSFQANIAENEMEYSYFLFTNEKLKEKGLKLAVVFIHRDFKLEVWLSGFNRKIQAKYYDLLKNRNTGFELADDPARRDYLLRVGLNESADSTEASLLLDRIKSVSNELIELAEKLD